MPQGLGIQLGLGGGRSATASGSPAGGGAFENEWSISLDGSDDRIIAGAITSFTMNAFSVWVKPSVSYTSSTAFKFVIAFGDYDEGLVLGGDATGKLTDEVITIIGAGGNYMWGYTGSGVTINTDWHHIAGTWESSSSSTNPGNAGYDIYLDAVKVGNSSGYWSAGADHAIAVDNVTVGSKLRAPTFSRYFGGLVDEVGLFSSALSASDISAIYNSGAPQSIEDYSPVMWWRMGDNDGGTGSTITDQGSGGNDGTLVNSPSFSTTVPS